MVWLLDAVYLVALLLLSPWLIYRAWRTGRYRRGLRDKLLGLRHSLCSGPVWFHGVSVGEIHLLRQVISAFQKRYPGVPCVISTTTDTGFDEARRCFPELPVFFFPFDFSWSVARTLRAVNPTLVVLAECELWPQFLHALGERGVPVAVINGRMSPRSLRRYRQLGRLARWLFQSLDVVAVQTEEYAQAFVTLGARPENVHITGSVKFDGVTADRNNPATQKLRDLFVVQPSDLVWICGSTQAPEEEIALEVYRAVCEQYPTLRLFLVPRQRDRFEEVARLLHQTGISFVRRSQLTEPTQATVVLVDTIGELGGLWGLADVAFVGGSLDGRRGGQNMLEPAAYGVAVLFGPHVWNFRDVAERLGATGGATRVEDATQLHESVSRLLADPSERQRMGQAAQRFVRQQQGATEKTITLLGQHLKSRPHPPLAA